MKMKSINIIIIGTLILSASACSKLFDKKPDFVSPDEYFNNEAQLVNALNGVYNRLIDRNFRMYSGGLFSIFVVNDESYFKSITANNIRVMTMNAADLDIGRFWECLYEGVNRANLLLENLDRVEMNVTKKNAIKGEALFLRGYFYFLLADFFGPVPLKLNATQSPNDPTLPRAELKDIYAHIVNDMVEAEALVHEIDEFNFNERVSKTAVQAVLARVFLKMAGEPLKDTDRYADALRYANKVIESGKHSLNPDFKQIFINHSQDKYDSKECIWEIGMFGDNTGNLQQAGTLGIANGILCPDEQIGYSTGPMCITAKLYQLFGTSDTLRRDWSIAPYRYVTTNGITQKQYYTAAQIYDRTPGKWRREYEIGIKNRAVNSTNFPVIRYSDVLLMKAEAENAVRQSPTIEAIEAVNMVRRRAFGKPLDEPNPVYDMPAGLDKVKFQEYIQDERMRELCFEGIRRHDLIRWGKYVSTMNELGQSISTTAPSALRYAGNAGLNTTDRNTLFPIPNTEVMINKSMTQNPGW